MAQSSAPDTKSMCSTSMFSNALKLTSSPLLPLLQPPPQPCVASTSGWTSCVTRAVAVCLRPPGVSISTRSPWEMPRASAVLGLIHTDFRSLCRFDRVDRIEFLWVCDSAWLGTFMLVTNRSWGAVRS